MNGDNKTNDRNQMNTELIAISMRLANVLLISAPPFAPGSVGADAVNIAKNIKLIIEELKNKDNKNED